MTYERITRYAGRLAEDPGTLGEMEREGDVVYLSTYDQSPLMESFQRDFYDGGFADQDYFATLERAGIDFSRMEGKPTVDGLDAPALLAVLTFCIRSERFGEGDLYHHAVSGILDDCLEALATLDAEDEKAIPHQ